MSPAHTRNSIPVSIDFTDVETLGTYVGDDWSDWGPERRIEESDISQFAQLTDNSQWIHTDRARAANESPYGGIIVHGLYLLALIPTLMPQEDFVVVGHKQWVIRGSHRFRFPSPVYPDEHVHARARLTNVRRVEKGTILTRDVEVWKTSPTDRPGVTCSLMVQYF